MSGNILPPPSTGVPPIQDGSRLFHFTPVWRDWFLKLAEIINKSGGLAGAVPAGRTITTTAPLMGGGDLTEDRTLSVDEFSATTKGVVPFTTTADKRMLRADKSWTGGFTGTIETAALTPGGSSGSMTFEEGVLVSQIPAT